MKYSLVLTLFTILMSASNKVESANCSTLERLMSLYAQKGCGAKPQIFTEKNGSRIYIWICMADQNQHLWNQKPNSPELCFMYKEGI